MDAYIKQITSDNELRKFAKISQVNFNGDNQSYQVIFTTYYETADGSILKADVVERIIDSRINMVSPTIPGTSNITDSDDTRLDAIQTALSPIFDDILVDYNNNITTTTTSTTTTTTTV